LAAQLLAKQYCGNSTHFSAIFCLHFITIVSKLNYNTVYILLALISDNILFQIFKHYYSIWVKMVCFNAKHSNVCKIPSTKSRIRTVLYYGTVINYLGYISTDGIIIVLYGITTFTSFLEYFHRLSYLILLILIL